MKNHKPKKRKPAAAPAVGTRGTGKSLSFLAPIEREHFQQLEESLLPSVRKIKTLGAACKAIGTTVGNSFNWMEKAGYSKSFYAYIKLVIITAALNEGWIPDPNDEFQGKYYPVFNILRDGTLLTLLRISNGHIAMPLPHSLTYKKEHVAKYSAIRFRKIWSDYLLLPKPKAKKV